MKMNEDFKYKDAKEMSIAFLEYHRRFRLEEGVWFHRECEKLGGMFSLADYGIENIYDDFVARKPIKSESMPGVVHEFDGNGKLVAMLNGKPLI